jgi:WhiB family redox-sensing transcriptional regulator
MSTGWRIDDQGNWRKRAQCSAENREKFFPDGRPSNEPFDLCEDCPVRDLCLETALSSPWKPYGIWGGKTTKELWPLWFERHPRSRENEVLKALGLTA